MSGRNFIHYPKKIVIIHINRGRGNKKPPGGAKKSPGDGKKPPDNEGGSGPQRRRRNRRRRERLERRLLREKRLQRLRPTASSSLTTSTPVQGATMSKEREEPKEESVVLPTSIKIKQEKITPPGSPVAKVIGENPEPSVNPPDSLFDTNLNPVNEDKKSIIPLKSSNELLAELFDVFNAKPPESIISEISSTKSKKKKKKHKKHKKKSKSSNNDSKSESDSKDNDDENVIGKKVRKEKKDKSPKSKESKKHKSKKHKKDDKNGETSSSTAVIKEVQSVKQERASDSTKPKENDGPSKEFNRVINKTTNALKITISNTSDIAERIKNPLSTESQKNHKKPDKPKEKEPAKKKRKRGSSSSSSSSTLSLSDEETWTNNYGFAYPDRPLCESYGYEPDYMHIENDFYRGRDRPLDRRWRSPPGRRGHASPNRSRRRSRSRSRSPQSRLNIDKKRLLEIARKNAIAMFKNGSLPNVKNMNDETKARAIEKMRYGGKTIEEFTEFCKKISKAESLGDLSSISSLSGDSDHDGEGKEKAFHHPFVLKDRGPIVMNIKNSTPIPPKSAEQTKALLMQFPVSSGQHHRQNESEWIPVVPKKTAPTKSKPKPDKTAKEPSNTVPTKESVPTVAPTPVPPVLVSPVPVQPVQHTAESVPVVMPLLPPPLPPTLPSIPTPEVVPPSESVFPITDPSASNVDVSMIISQRLDALRKLQENPLDPIALKTMYNAQKDMSAWAASKFTPGQFTGTTGANVLSARELSCGYQAWAKKDQLKNAAPVSGGMGMHLLQKMGWKPGEGLGREKNGSLQPLLLDVKLDKRGLTTTNMPQPAPKRIKVVTEKKQVPQEPLDQKHPVSLLGELSAKHKWGAPFYEVIQEDGPSHARNFLFRVTLGGKIYQPAHPNNNKKLAKATAAKFVLQQMGII